MHNISRNKDFLIMKIPAKASIAEIIIIDTATIVLLPSGAAVTMPDSLIVESVMKLIKS
jgi:hypothetical protein